MERKKVTVKGVDKDAWEMLKQLREIEQRFVGAILSDCIRDYWEDGFADCE
ncbi:hypothetical protein [Phaeobacter sp. Ax4a-4a]|uniref:hypothetical protein n=1 Tax=Phaeobacter sp. Ax4a-4a TaxID=3112437 RepID=UPI003A83D0A8